MAERGLLGLTGCVIDTLYSLPMEFQATPTQELAQELGAVLARLYGFLRRAILPREMSLTQALALNTLRDLGPQRVTDLAQLEGVRQPTCTGLINAMEGEGWVRRCVDEADKRVVLVDLTEAGHAVLDSMSEARAAVLDRYLGALSETDRDTLAAALPGLSRLIERGVDEQGAPHAHIHGAVDESLGPPLST
jgi:DNA-binding MarR family transcriptional regulator